jgi:hypothetical protein
MNVKLLRKVKRWIEEHPESYTYDWLANGCGTRGCIAGHTLLLGRKDLKGKRTAEIEKILHKEQRGGDGIFTGAARKLLRISEPAAARLFINWPAPFSASLNKAKVAAARIEHFIKTRGRE